MKTLARVLHERIAAAGIPLDGVAQLTADTWRVDYNAAATQPQRDAGDAIVTAFDEVAEQSKLEAQDAAQDVARRKAKEYLRDQLVSASPSLATIFTNIKNFVDGNAQLLQALNNNIDVMSLAYGWNAANVKAATGASTNQIKAQYIEAAKSIVAIFA